MPLIYRWPGVIAPGSKADTPVSCEDFFPTLLDAAGVETPHEAKAIEGVSYLPLLTGKAEHQQRPSYQHFPHHRGRAKSFNGGSSLRSGDWKLIWWHGADSVELYQLADDIGESKNLAADQPARAAAMKQQLQQWLANTNANMPRPNPNYAHSAKQDVVP